MEISFSRGHGASWGRTESITGVLMCGLSVTFLFAVVHRLVESDERAELVEEGPKG
jgi:hypothetical protein